jgi:membrane protein YdbS with pleckstrin-like domain
VTGPTPLDLPSRASKDVEKYLLPDETAVVATRRHWAVLIEPTAKFLPVLVAGSWLLLFDPDNRVTSSAGLLVVLASLVYYGLRVGEWWMRHFIVSTRRVLLTSGVIVRTVTLLPLRRITDLTWKETLLGQVLGYGTFRFESAGQQQALSEITFLPGADVLYRRVSALLFSSDWGGGGGAASTGDDEGNPEPPTPPTPPTPPPSEGDRQDTKPIPGLPPRQS